jgi:hydroxymethylpyrimidine kinase/phosphomethylpyrimidine kinase
LLGDQLEAVFSDIVPDAIKIGMLADENQVAVITDYLRRFPTVPAVIDPVLLSSSGHRLLSASGIPALARDLFPLARCVTPNIGEAEALTGLSIRNHAGMESAALSLLTRINDPFDVRSTFARTPRAVLLKGGHSASDADDFLLDGDEGVWFTGPRVATANTHGTGCTLSSAIAAGLGRGLPLRQAVSLAKAYVTGAMSAGLRLGHGAGPLDHGWAGVAFPEYYANALRKMQ